MSADWRASASLRRVVWLVPVAIALHNLEEGLALRPWLHAHGAQLQQVLHRLGVAFLWPTLTDTDRVVAGYTVALVIVTVAPLLIVLAAQASPRRAGLYAVLVVQGVMFANVFTHTVTAVLSGGYAPGVATALAINLPLSWVLFRRARREGEVGRGTLRALVVGGAVALLPLSALVLAVSGTLARSR